MSYYDDEYDDPPRRGWWSTFVMIVSWTVSASVIVLALAVALLFETYREGPHSMTGRDTIVMIPRGSGVSGISQKLEQAGVVRNAIAFRVAAEFYAHGRPLMAGEYSIRSGESPVSILDKMVEGKMMLHLVTVPEGWTSAMVVDQLAAADVLVGEIPAVPPEGSLLPESYNVERGATRESVLQEMAAAHGEHPQAGEDE